MADISFERGRNVLRNKKYFGFFLLFLGIAVLASILISSRTCKVTETWPSVIGQIVKSEAVPYDEGKRLTAEIAYEYSVERRNYSSKKLRAFKVLGIKVVESHTLVEEFPLGNEIEVFYDPEDHSNSALLHGPPGKIYLGIIGPAIMIIFGFGFAFSEKSKQGNDSMVDDRA